MISALISGSETAFFSLSSSQLEEIYVMDNSKSQRIIKLLNKPKQLLATILIANNFINVAIVILSAYITGMVFNFSGFPILGFIIEVVIVTFLLLLLGEITPKVYANQYNIRFALQVSNPIYIIHNAIKPLSRILAFSTSVVDRRISKKGHDISKSELDDAIELTSGDITYEEEKSMLKGIVKFSDMETSEIMKARVDISAIDLEDEYADILKLLIQSGYSRIPVYKESLDQIKGILYIKDLLPYLNEKPNFEWQELIRPAFFVPENKKINELLQEFRQKKIHLAIVVDEYGGTSGLVTLEDILEEIVGEINDEFDDLESDVDFEKIDDYTYVFEAKTSINDFCKVLKIDDDIFDEVEGDYDTIAGLVLELYGNIPKKGMKVMHHQYTFEVITLDYKRIKKIKVFIEHKEE
ncbi:gliding motility-associated protein GldE [Lentimicrobium sp. L6]|nr:gliding motility-associated protein GldE [Lentimicrobium sp. S6]NPD83409.1 gliding motility-associated protein GldE [Lentimicrobium sp. L6]